MKGIHKVTIKKRNILYELTLQRNITIIKGDSATGKTEMVKAVHDYAEQGKNSGVHLQCDKKCVVLHGRDWYNDLENIHDS